MIQYDERELQEWGQKHMPSNFERCYYDASHLTITEAEEPRPKAKPLDWITLALVIVFTSYVFALGFIGLAHQLRAWLG